MKRMMLFAVALSVLSGCQGQNRPPAPKDPFLFGPTRVPPPGTGAAVGRGADGYYRGAPPAARPVPSNTPSNTRGSDGIGPIGVQPGSAPSRMAPATVPRQQSWNSTDAEPVARSVADNRASTAIPAQPAERAPNLLAGRERVVRELPPRSAAASPRSLRPTPATAPPYRAAPRPARRRVEISELPPSNSQSAAEVERGGEEPAFRLVSATEAPESPSRVERAAATEPARPRSIYGHAADYSWVRGRLEHSQVEGRWKLRYIPIDGKTDDFGGSVVLPDPSVLSCHERGEFLELRGELADVEPETGFAPLYEVAEVVSIEGGRSMR